MKIRSLTLATIVAISAPLMPIPAAALVSTELGATVQGSYCDGYRDGYHEFYRNQNAGNPGNPGCPGNSGGFNDYSRGYQDGSRAAHQRFCYMNHIFEICR